MSLDIFNKRWILYEEVGSNFSGVLLDVRRAKKPRWGEVRRSCFDRIEAERSNLFKGRHLNTSSRLNVYWYVAYVVKFTAVAGVSLCLSLFAFVGVHFDWWKAEGNIAGSRGEQCHYSTSFKLGVLSWLQYCTNCRCLTLPQAVCKASEKTEKWEGLTQCSDHGSWSEKYCSWLSTIMCGRCTVLFIWKSHVRSLMYIVRHTIVLIV